MLMEDYQLPANQQQITLKGTQTSTCFNVTIIDDSSMERRECVTLKAVISSANVDYTLTEEETQICIMDNDGEL